MYCGQASRVCSAHEDRVLVPFTLLPHTPTHVHTQHTHMRNILRHACICTHTHVYTHAQFTRAHTDIHTYAHTVHVCVCARTHAHTMHTPYVHTHSDMHTYAQTQCTCMCMHTSPPALTHKVGRTTVQPSFFCSGKRFNDFFLNFSLWRIWDACKVERTVQTSVLYCYPAPMPAAPPALSKPLPLPRCHVIFVLCLFKHRHLWWGFGAFLLSLPVLLWGQLALSGRGQAVPALAHSQAGLVSDPGLVYPAVPTLGLFTHVCPALVVSDTVWEQRFRVRWGGVTATLGNVSDFRGVFPTPL